MFLNNLIVLVCNFCFSNSVYNKANIFLCLIEYELNSLLGASHLVDYISVHIQFDLERYLLNMHTQKKEKNSFSPGVFDYLLHRTHSKCSGNAMRNNIIIYSHITCYIMKNIKVGGFNVEWYMTKNLSIELL